MNKLHKALVGLFVALAVATPLGLLAVNATTHERPVSIVRVATDNTPTPTPPFGGGPCPGGHC